MIEQLYARPGTIARLRSGPLGDHVDAFAEMLSKQGYSPSGVRRKIATGYALGQWLSRQQHDLAMLDERRICEFRKHCRSGQRSKDGISATLGQLLRYLRQVGAVPASVPRALDTRQPIEKEYEDYLAYERGLTAPTIRYQLYTARRFLTERFGTGVFDCSRLCAADVTEFALRHVKEYTLRSAQTMLSALRSFLRFLYMRGETEIDLTGCIFRVANWRLSGLPTYLDSKEVEQLLQSVDRKTRSGLRDYAILLLLARLGLRGG